MNVLFLFDNEIVYCLNVFFLPTKKDIYYTFKVVREFIS